VHPNRQVAVLLIVLKFRLFFWGIVPRDFICCDPCFGVGGANEDSLWRRRMRRRRVRRRRSRPRCRRDAGLLTSPRLNLDCSRVMPSLPWDKLNYEEGKEEEEGKAEEEEEGGERKRGLHK